MKSYQLVFDDKSNFLNQLSRIKNDTLSTSHSDIVFYLTWTGVSDELVSEVAGLLNDYFPDSIYYGNEASGCIVNGKLRFGIAVTCYVFEDKDTHAELIWVERGARYSSLEDLWKYCSNREGLRAVELIPSMSYLGLLNIDNNIPSFSEDILVFGGASAPLDTTNVDAKVIAKGHPITKDGMSAILYFGDNLNVSDDYVLGWKGLGRYMKVTKSHAKVVNEMDGMPAFGVYEKYLDLKSDDQASMIFPLIVEEDGIEYIRSPQLVLPDKSITVFAHIPEGTLARIAYGDKNTILDSLYDKAEEISKFKPQIVKTFSCAGRRIFWGDEEIHKETTPFQEIAPTNGFYTGGEIFRFGKKLRVLNQTLVIISFREGDGSSQKEIEIDMSERKDKSLISRITHFVEVVAEEQKEALAFANEEKLRNDIIHKVIHSGKWSYFINEKDEIVGHEYSEDAKRIIHNNVPEGLDGWRKIIHPDDVELVFNALFETVKDHTCNTPYDVSYRIVDRKGVYHWFHSAGRIVRDENGMGELYGIHIDISDQIEAQLRQQEELEEALHMADSANRAKTEFLFNMSHDIRTPMNAILGFTNMGIKHIKEEEKALDCLHKIQQSGDLLLSLINNVLEVSRIESGKAEMNEQAGDVFYSFVDIENTMKAMAESKDIDLKFEVSDIIDRYVMCDYSRCERVFVNIISNAIKYTNPCGYVKVRCRQLEKAKHGVARYQYIFEDNGIGMSEEFQQHVFEQFSRERTVTKTGIQGTGLGMAVCKSYVEFMGGTIECRSKIDVGTTFIVTLPFKVQKEGNYIDPETKELITGQRKKRKSKKLDFKGKRVLLTEDNELNREIAVELLEEKGIVVEEAADGTFAIEMLKEKGPDYYDVILMDIQMPIMGGYDATREIRKMYPDKKIPIIALSANAFSEDKTASLEAGMDGHVAKPINTDELFTAMAKFL